MDDLIRLVDVFTLPQDFWTRSHCWYRVLRTGTLFYATTEKLCRWVLLSSCRCHSLRTLKSQLLLQLTFLLLRENRLSGTLPGSWAGLTQASHAANTNFRSLFHGAEWVFAVHACAYMYICKLLTIWTSSPFLDFAPYGQLQRALLLRLMLPFDGVSATARCSFVGPACHVGCDLRHTLHCTSSLHMINMQSIETYQ